MNRRRIIQAIGLLTLAPAAGTARAAADAYPSRPLHFVNPSPPGGVTDLCARTVAAGMAEALGQPVVVENRGGARQTLGSQYVSRAAPDGYTILLATIGAMAINPYLIASLPYHPLRGFTPISLLGYANSVVYVNAASPVRSLTQLIEMGRGGRTLNFATPGIGTSPHLAAELMRQRTGVALNHVPYPGSGQVVQDMIGGQQLDFACDNLGPSIPHIRAGKLRALAVTSSTRSRQLPEVPCIAETIAGIDVKGWMAAFGPPGLPADIVAALNKAILTSLARADTRKTLEAASVELTPSTPAEAFAYVKDEYERWGTVLKGTDIKLD